MRRTIISAVIGAGIAGATVFFVDTYRDIRTATQFAEAQKAAPSDWLLIEGFQAYGARSPEEPRLQFVGTPSQNLLIRVAVSSRNSESGDVLCSGGGQTVLYEGGVPVTVNAPVSRLAGLDACEWPVGRYNVRLTFLMTEPDSRVAKTLLIETTDVEVIASNGGEQ